MNGFPAVAAILLIVVALLVVLRALLRSGSGLVRRVVVPEWQTGLHFRDGRFMRLLPTGAHWFWPRDRVAFLSKSEITLVTAAQEVLSADLLQVKITAVIVYRIENPRLAFESVAAGYDSNAGVLFGSGVQAALYRDCQLALRDIAGARALGQLLADRKDADAALLAVMAPLAARYGIVVEGASVRDIILGAEMRRLYAEKERVRIEGETALERARSEQATLRSLANAARLMKDNPDLAMLRLIQTLTPPPGAPAPTIVFGAPVLPQGALGRNGATDTKS